MSSYRNTDSKPFRIDDNDFWIIKYNPKKLLLFVHLGKLRLTGEKKMSSLPFHTCSFYEGNIILLQKSMYEKQRTI